tara:strand:- start:6579 stop:6917 length:339 start_codon:yes stop_codon:yes gene_type:complete
MIYYVKYRDKYASVTNLRGVVEDYLERRDWNLDIYCELRKKSVSLQKEDLDGPELYTREIDTPGFEIQVPVSIDNLNLINGDDFELTRDDARITILKLNNYLKTITNFVCVK